MRNEDDIKPDRRAIGRLTTRQRQAFNAELVARLPAFLDAIVEDIQNGHPGCSNSQAENEIKGGRGIGVKKF
jgi:hypothetical protein